MKKEKKIKSGKETKKWKPIICWFVYFVCLFAVKKKKTKVASNIDRMYRYLHEKTICLVYWCLKHASNQICWNTEQQYCFLDVWGLVFCFFFFLSPFFSLLYFADVSATLSIRVILGIRMMTNALCFLKQSKKKILFLYIW